MDHHFIYTVINFILFVGVLYFAIRKPARAFWKERAAEIKHHIQTARTRREKAITEYERLSQRVDQLTQEMEALREKMRADGQLEKENLVAEANRNAQQIQETAKRIIKQEEERAIRRLKKLTSELAIDRAQAILKQQLSEQDQSRLIDSVISQLKSEKTAFAETSAGRTN